MSGVELPQTRMEPVRIVEMAAVGGTVESFLAGHLRHLSELGYDVHVVASRSPGLFRAADASGATAWPIEIPREISPLKDFKAVLQLCALFRRIRPHIVNAGTPKAGLLGMLAARITGVPVRIYMLRGLRLETCRGWKRRLLSLTEWIASACAHRVVSVSPSLGKLYVESGLCPSEKLFDEIISSHGVDSVKFAPRREASDVILLRNKLGIGADSPVIGFVGRLTRDKGVEDLATAFRTVQQQIPECRLLMIGELELGDAISPQVVEELRSNPRIILTGTVQNTADFYNLMDVLAFPSYREGLPNAPLEAAASEVPTVGFAVTGTVDAVLHNETGWLVPKGDAQAFAKQLIHCLTHSEERLEFGRTARQRVERDFVSERIHASYERLYKSLLHQQNLPARQEDLAGSAYSDSSNMMTLASSKDREGLDVEATKAA